MPLLPRQNGTEKFDLSVSYATKKNIKHFIK